MDLYLPMRLYTQVPVRLEAEVDIRNNYVDSVTSNVESEFTSWDREDHQDIVWSKDDKRNAEWQHQLFMRDWYEAGKAREAVYLTVMTILDQIAVPVLRSKIMFTGAGR